MRATSTAEKESPVAVLLRTTKTPVGESRSVVITSMLAKMVASIVTTGKMGTGLTTAETDGSRQAGLKPASSSSRRRGH